ncbi:MAG: hypothetical protein MUC31_04900 [Bacteroidales bacterium]|nr:hypothetical protein [Bacteroidales bacterium]
MFSIFNKSGKQKIRIAILIVNGTHDFMDKLWLEISLGNIIRFTSGLHSFKVFVWNHNRNSKKVSAYLQSFGDLVECLDENSFDMSRYDPDKKYIYGQKGYVFSEGWHVHRTPLQILYEHAVTAYEIDTVFTFDTDSCPIRNNWDIPLVYALDHGYKIAGIWRDELQVQIPPYIHPSCLGIKTGTIQKLGLRFDHIPVFPREDSVSNFTAAVVEKYGPEAIFPVKRNNGFQYHSVFNGIYGGMLYHHHFGTRLRSGRLQHVTSFGWKERGEMLAGNKIVMDSTTRMLFLDPQNFMNELAYGDHFMHFKLFMNYLYANYSRFRCCRLWVIARQSYDNDKELSFFLLSLISKEFLRVKAFLEFYAEVCRALGMEMEAAAYEDLTRES